MADTASKRPAKSEATPEKKYTVERLMRDCAIFTGHPPHVLAGALHGDDRKELTVSQAKKAITAWLGE